MTVPGMGVGGGNGSAVNCKHCDCGGRPPMRGECGILYKDAGSGTWPVLHLPSLKRRKISCPEELYRGDGIAAVS